MTDEREAIQAAAARGAASGGNGARADARLAVRGEVDPPEALVGADAPVAPAPAVAVPGHDPLQRLRTLLKLRDTVRVELHRQLDDLLALPSQHAELSTDLGGTMLDEIVGDVSRGFGFTVSVETKHPQEEGRAVEDPSLTVAKPMIEVVR